MRKASTIEVFLSIISNNLSFGIVIKVSTFAFKFAIPASACFKRFLPSKVNGLVTTPTVRAPTSLAHSATIGAPPVPVPPPIPAVTKIISAPCNAFMISSRFS